MDLPPPAKRPRLSMACNICRQRKVKCDAEYPKCRNCKARNQICITTDPQRPSCPGVREWLEVPEKQTPGTTEVHRNSEENQAGAPRVPRQAQLLPLSSDLDHGPAAESEESPIRQPFDTSVNTEHGTNRTKILGGSSSQCLAKSLDVYFKSARMKPISGFFRHGMRHAEELDLALELLLPELPEADKRARCLSVYRSRVHPLYPLVNIDALSATIDDISAVPNYKALSRDDIPTLVSAYLIMSIGLDEAAQRPTEDGDRYLHAAAGLLAHIMVVPYLPTVQALLLFTIAYRGHNQEGLAWQTLGIAIRIAYTLGLHRRTSKPEHNVTQKDLYTRVWAVCCSFEKAMHLASGWPTLISDDLMAQAESIDSTGNRFLHWHLGLAHYQGNISHHLYSYRSGTKTRSVRQILLDTARLDRELLAWSNEIPSDLRPGNDLICSNDDFHIMAFLSIEYHATMIALHRAALIAPKSKIEEEVMKHCPDDPSRFRLANGEALCVNSARAIAKLSIELQDRGIDSCLIPAGSAILSCIALAIYLMKHPTSRLQAMDLQLLKACLAYSSTRMGQCNIDPQFIEGLAVTYEQIRAHLEQHATGEASQLAPSIRGRSQMYDHHALSPTIIQRARNPGQLPTPSSYDPTVQILQSPMQYDRAAPINGSSRANAQRRAHSFSHPVSQIRNDNHLDWHDPGRDQFLQNTPLDSSAHGFLDGLSVPNPEDIPNDLDAVFPFEGFNVEDLWNWMLYFDSPPSTAV